MTHLLDARLIALHSQHSLQSQDLLKLVNLAQSDGMVDDIEADSFEKNLGLAVHLFVSTQRADTLEQLAVLLPKFGSEVVLPLIKILCRVPRQEPVSVLAQQALKSLGLYPLVIGLNLVLDREADISLRKTAINWLVGLIQENKQSILWILPRLVSLTTWQLLTLQLLETTAYPVFDQETSSQKNNYGDKNLAYVN